MTTRQLHYLSQGRMLWRAIYPLFLKPRALNEDDSRREYVLTILLLGSITFSLLAFLIVLVNYLVLQGDAERLTRLLIIGGVVSFFLLLYSLVRLRFNRQVAYVLIGLYFALGTYTLYAWGILLPQGLLVYALVLIMSGILISSRFAFFMASLIAATLLTLAHWENTAVITPDRSWASQSGSFFDDAVGYGLTFFIIMLVSWLSNYQLERSLNRARRAEAALKRERDQLEVRVQERTKELKQTQVEKMAQLYRFAEFGRMTSGLLHDLVNPLTAVSLNLERLSTQERSELLERAIESTKHMERFIRSARHQVEEHEDLSLFSVADEIDQAIHILNHKARLAGVKLRLTGRARPQLYGNPSKFHQLLSNLIANAIEAYEDLERPASQRVVTVNLQTTKQLIKLTIHDWGIGIERENLAKVFEPFFTTKSAEKGTGIGLSIVKEIVERNFFGRIKVSSSKDKGTTFTINIPFRGKP